MRAVPKSFVPAVNRRGDRVYTVVGKNGATYIVDRHQWEIPRRYSAWKAEAPGQKTVYGDTLQDVHFYLGLNCKHCDEPAVAGYDGCSTCGHVESDHRPQIDGGACGAPTKEGRCYCARTRES